MKRIMLFISSLSCGGAERVLTNIANGLCQRGFEVHLVTWTLSKQEDFYPLQPEVIRHRIGPSKPVRGTIKRLLKGYTIVKKMRGLLKTYRPNAVLSFLDRTNILVTLTALGLNIRVIISERTDLNYEHLVLPFSWRLIRPAVYRLCDVLVVQTKAMKQWINKNWKINTIIIPNGISSMPKLLDIKKPLIISVGRLATEKGFDISLKAFAQVHQQHPEWRYIILGDGPLHAELETLSQQLGIQDKVTFKGRVDNPIPWLKQASICIQPSRFEGFPNAVMESMAMGLATISSDASDSLSELITHGENGLLIPCDHVNAFTHALEKLMANKEYRKRLGQQATSVRQKFSQDNILNQWIQALQI